VALVLYHSGYPDAGLSDGCLRGLAGFGGAIVVVSDRPCQGIECISPHHPDLVAAIGQRLHRLQLEA